MGQGDWGRAQAKRIYTTTGPGYHAVTRSAVEKALAGKS